MKLRFTVLLLSLVTIFGISASAQEQPKVDVFAGYSYLRSYPATPGVGGFNLNGGSASAAYNFRDWVSGVADFGGYHVGTADGVNVDDHVLTYMFGPRFTYRGHRRITPFGQVLFGAAHTGSGFFASANSHNALATSFGGGVDWNVRDRFSVRPVQFDYLLTHFPEATSGSNLTQNNLRVSAGIVFHFK